MSVEIGKYTHSNVLIKSIDNFGCFEIVITRPFVENRNSEFKISEDCFVESEKINLIDIYFEMGLESDKVLTYKDVIRLYKMINKVNSEYIKNYIDDLDFHYYNFCVNYSGILASLNSTMYLLYDHLLMNKGNITIIRGKIKECTTRNILHHTSTTLKTVRLLLD